MTDPGWYQQVPERPAHQERSARLVPPGTAPQHPARLTPPTTAHQYPARPATAAPPPAASPQPPTFATNDGAAAYIARETRGVWAVSWGRANSAYMAYALRIEAPAGGALSHPDHAGLARMIVDHERAVTGGVLSTGLLVFVQR